MFWLLWLLSILFAAAIGGQKNMAGTGFLLGVFLGPLGVLVIWALKGNRRNCPYCQELINKAAVKCPKCQSFVGPVTNDDVEVTRKKLGY